jgi:hypothetical protein
MQFVRRGCYALTTSQLAATTARAGSLHGEYTVVVWQILNKHAVCVPVLRCKSQNNAVAMCALLQGYFVGTLLGFFQSHTDSTQLFRLLLG